MCIYMCVEVVLINILASHLAPPIKNSWLRPYIYLRFELLVKVNEPSHQPFSVKISM